MAKTTKKREAVLAAPAPVAGESEIDVLKRRLAHTEALLAVRQEASTQPIVNGSPQPSPADVTPGQVWRAAYKDETGKEIPGKFVPFEPDPRTQFKYQVRTPVKTFNGEKGGVKFREGLGGTNDPDLARWFLQTLGYKVTPPPPAAQVIKEQLDSEDESVEEEEPGDPVVLDEPASGTPLT